MSLWMRLSLWEKGAGSKNFAWLSPVVVVVVTVVVVVVVVVVAI